MAESGRLSAAAERGSKRQIHQHRTAAAAANQEEADPQESSSRTPCVESSADSGIFYLNPLTPKWSFGISERCLEITSNEEDGISVQSEERDVMNCAEKARTLKPVKLKVLKFKKRYLVPQTSNGTGTEYLAGVSSTSSDEIWVQSRDSGEGKIVGKRTFKKVMPKLKLLKIQKHPSNQHPPNGNIGIMDKSEEKEIWTQSHNGGIKFVENPRTSSQAPTKLNLLNFGKPILNVQTPNRNSGNMENDSPSEEKKETFARTSKQVTPQTPQPVAPEELCDNLQTKPSTNVDFTMVDNRKERITDHKLSENDQQVTNKLKDLQVRENQLDKEYANSKSEEIRVQSHDSGEGRIAGKRTFKQLIPSTFKPVVQEELCANSQTKTSSNVDNGKVDNHKECITDQSENDQQVTNKLKENQLDKVTANAKSKDDLKLSRLLEAMKKRSGDIDAEERPFKCPHCHWAFKKLCYLQSHVTTHSGLKPHVCDVCGKAYSHQGTLQQHKRLHTGERPYRCPFCERSYIWSSDYRKHIRTHTGEKPYECKECGKDFIRSSDLRKHERNMHTNNKPFPCSHCDKTFNRPLSLKRHERKHLGERPYSCPDCGKKFALASRMAEHRKIHKGVRPFVCSVCGKCFTKSSNLTEHEAIHSGVRPHRCGECGVAFAMASRLVRHQYVHSKGKPHSCAGCGRNFSCLAGLEQHQQLNCAGRIFICVQCDKSFMCADKLTQHMQQQHKDQQHKDQVRPT